ncbi:annexin B11-like isoform X2 [Macrobrachium nipponense]|uniref:annexin B11-like isoform X2 n=1 Tax=Macrobrachium nipponense TaxID=159736 RepID=UPI0030C7E647
MASPKTEEAATAECLKNALQGLRPDEDVLIDILCRRTHHQRQEIRRKYQLEYRRDLIDDARHKFRGKFGEVVVALLTPMPEYLAQELHRALRGRRQEVFLEVFCSYDNTINRAIKKAYYESYAITLESAIRSQHLDDFQMLLESLVSNERDEEDAAIPELPLRVARQLYQAVGGAEPDKGELRRIFTTYSYQTLRDIFQMYCEVAGKQLEDVLRGKADSDEFFEGLLTAYYSIQNPTAFFAREFRSSMEGLGTRDRQLIRLVVTRSQVDMKAIKNEYKRIFNRSLKKDIKLMSVACPLPLLLLV